MLQSLQIMFNLYTLRRSDKKRQWWSIGVDSNRARSFMTQERGKEDRELEENDIKDKGGSRRQRRPQILDCTPTTLLHSRHTTKKKSFSQSVKYINSFSCYTSSKLQMLYNIISTLTKPLYQNFGNGYTNLIRSFSSSKGYFPLLNPSLPCAF